MGELRPLDADPARKAARPTNNRPRNPAKRHSLRRRQPLAHLSRQIYTVLRGVQLGSVEIQDSLEAAARAQATGEYKSDCALKPQGSRARQLISRDDFKPLLATGDYLVTRCSFTGAMPARFVQALDAAGHTCPPSAPMVQI